MIQQALAGEDVTITEVGQPLVRLTPVEVKKLLGSARGTMSMTDDWDSPETNAEIAEMFNGPIYPPDEV